MRFTMKYVNTDGRAYYYRRNGRSWGRIDGAPGSVEFAASYARIHATFERPDAKVVVPGTFAAMAAAYLGSAEFTKNLKPKTQAAYRADVDYLRRIFDAFRPDQIEVKHVLAMRDKLADKPGKANMTIRTMRCLYAWGRSRGLCKTNPADLKGSNVKALRMGEHQPWPPDAVARFRAGARPHLVLAMELGLWTGQRQGDLIRIRWDDIRDGMIRVRQEKTSKEVWLPLAQPLIAALAEAPRSAVTVLVNDAGTPWKTANCLAQAFGDEMKKLGLTGLVFHGLRKTCAVLLAEAGATTKQISAVTGQSDQMVSYYARLAERGGMAREAITKLEKKATEQ
jgi:integrase